MSISGYFGISPNEFRADRKDRGPQKETAKRYTRLPDYDPVLRSHCRLPKPGDVPPAQDCPEAETNYWSRALDTYFNSPRSPAPPPVDPSRPCAHNEHMDRDHVLATLRIHEPELRAAGILRLSLFGSTARGDSRPDSDVDLLAAFDTTRRISLLHVAGMEAHLARLLGRTVDLVEEGTLKPRVQKNVEAEAVRAF